MNVGWLAKFKLSITILDVTQFGYANFPTILSSILDTEILLLLPCPPMLFQSVFSCWWTFFAPYHFLLVVLHVVYILDAALVSVSLLSLTICIVGVFLVKLSLNTTENSNWYEDVAIPSKYILPLESLYTPRAFLFASTSWLPLNLNKYRSGCSRTFLLTPSLSKIKIAKYTLSAWFIPSFCLVVNTLPLKFITTCFVSIFDILWEKTVGFSLSWPDGKASLIPKWAFFLPP